MYTYGQYIQVDNINETIYETIYKNQQLHVNRYRPINAGICMQRWNEVFVASGYMD